MAAVWGGWRAQVSNILCTLDSESEDVLCVLDYGIDFPSLLGDIVTAAGGIPEAHIALFVWKIKTVATVRISNERQREDALETLHFFYVHKFRSCFSKRQIILE